MLAEAQHGITKTSTPIHLREKGGRIVGELFLGLLYEDRQSFLREEPGWTPEPAFMNNGKFTMVDLLKQSMMA